MTVASNIKSYLESNGIKQAFLCEKTGLSPTQISDILNKGRKIDCLELYKICKALDVPLGTFFADVEV